MYDTPPGSHLVPEADISNQSHTTRLFWCLKQTSLINHIFSTHPGLASEPLVLQASGNLAISGDTFGCHFWSGCCYLYLVDRSWGYSLASPVKGLKNDWASVSIVLMLKSLPFALISLGGCVGQQC